MHFSRLVMLLVAALSAAFHQGCAHKFHQPASNLMFPPDVERSAVALPGVEPEKVKENNLRMAELVYPAGAVFVTVDDKGYILASGLTKVTAVLDLKGKRPRNAFILPGVDAIFIMHDPAPDSQAGEWEVHLSRFDLSTGMHRWTSSSGVHGLYMFSDSFLHDVSTLGIGLQSMSVAYSPRLSADGSTMLLYGLIGDPFRPKVRLARINVGTGVVLSDELFHAMRSVSESQVLFIGFNGRKSVEEDEDAPSAKTAQVNLKLVDVKTGTAVYEATVGAADLPISPNRIAPFGRVRGSAGSPFLCEVWPLVAGSRLYISSRCSSNSGFGNNYVLGPLISFDLNTPQAVPVIMRDMHPALDVEMPVTWAGWPKVFPDIEPDSFARVRGLVYFAEDGGVKKVTLPAETAFNGGRVYLTLDSDLRGMSWLVEPEKVWMLFKDRLFCIILADGALADSSKFGETGVRVREKIDGGLKLFAALKYPGLRQKLEWKLRDRANEILRMQRHAGVPGQPTALVKEVSLDETGYSKDLLLIPGRFDDKTGVLLVTGNDLLKDPPDVLAILPIAWLEGTPYWRYAPPDTYLFEALIQAERSTVITFQDKGRMLIYRLPLVLKGPGGVNEIKVEGR